MVVPAPAALATGEQKVFDERKLLGGQFIAAGHAAKLNTDQPDPSDKT